MFVLAVEEERAKLFEGSSNVDKPRMRTPQEILTKYKFGGVSHEHCNWSWFFAAYGS